MSAKFIASLLIGSICITAEMVAAAPIELVPGTINMLRDTRGINDVGIGQGDRFQFGANIVGGSAGTFLEAIYPPTGFTVPSFVCAPNTVNPNFCARSTPFTASRLDPWTLTFTRPGEAALVTSGPALRLSGQDITTQIPFPVSVTITGGGTSPTISWEVPAGTVLDGFRINIFDKSAPRLADGTADVILSEAVAANATSFSIPKGFLHKDRNYSINFQLIETRGHVPFTGNNAEILKRSSSFFAFTPLPDGSPPNVHLPEVGIDTDPSDDLGAVYKFRFKHDGPDSVTFIDPFVAVGYDYATGEGDPNFASLILPDIGDGEFLLSYIFNSTLFEEILQAGEQFFFQSDGVDAFKVRGIEIAAGLDPEDVTAFITGLTFVAPGEFTGTMTPVIEFVPELQIPEPTTLALFTASLGLLAAFRRRRIGERDRNRHM